MAKRINVILPDKTVSRIDRLVRRGQRSRFIQRAVDHYLASASQQALEERLRKAAIRDRDLDREIASDWLAVDREQWREFDAQERRRAETGQKEAKSTSRRSTRH